MTQSIRTCLCSCGAQALAAERLPPGCFACPKCGAVFRRRAEAMTVALAFSLLGELGEVRAAHVASAIERDLNGFMRFYQARLALCGVPQDPTELAAHMYRAACAVLGAEVDRRS